MGKWISWGVVGIAIVAALVGIGTYNNLVTVEQAAEAQWGQVQNVYQRRADLVPNLVETVKGAAAFEQETLTKVIDARARATAADPRSFAQYAQAQQDLSGALARLLVSVEAYPDLRATENFRTLQAQLEGTENRIAVERMRFNDAARAFNTLRSTFPTAVLVGFLGARFAEKPYFHAKEGAEQAPRVKFGS